MSSDGVRGQVVVKGDCRNWVVVSDGGGGLGQRTVKGE